MTDFEARVELDALMSSTEYWSPNRSPLLVERIEQLTRQASEAKARERRLAEAELERQARENAR